ncbi:MAG: SNF2 helicase-associated domain-containing protein, partial [Bacillota bacterium]|nr:SNF2 helicase-associated domain-containing protein [Bacillota bacterium]
MNKNANDYVIETPNEELIAVIEPDGLLELDWQETKEKIDISQDQFQKEIYKHYVENHDEALFFLGLYQKTISMSVSFRYIQQTAAAFIKKLSMSPEIEFLREKILVNITDDEAVNNINNAPYLSGYEYLNKEWIEKFWQKLNKTFSNMIKNYSGTVEQFLTSYNPNIHTAGRIFFHLVESKKEEYPFAFLATYTSETSKSDASKHLPLKNALIEYGKDNKKLLELLSTVNKASQKSNFISELVASGEIFHPIGLSASEAYTFLKEIPLYEESGIICRMPNWWKSKSNSLRMSVSIGNKTPSILNTEALVDFNAELYLGEQKVNAEEIKKLISE